MGAAFAPQEGTELEDTSEDASDFTFAGEPGLGPAASPRKPFGGEVGGPKNPSFGEGGWEKQGYMLQPLPGGFAYPSSNTMLRRDGFELSPDSNFDPIQAGPPRIKKAKGA